MKVSATESTVEPSGITTDAKGNIFVADSHHHLIRKITPQGLVTNYAGTGVSGCQDGPTLKATFHFHTGLGFDAHGFP